jgi:hypothetical protein
MMRFLFHDPMESMLDRFNQSERDRLLPAWRRAAWRLVLSSIVVVVLGAWAVAAYWESH